MGINEKIEFLSTEIDRLNNLINNLTPYQNDIVEDKKSNKQILDDAIFKKSILEQLLSELQ